MVVQAICSVHDVTLLYIRPKQAISIVEAGHVKSSNHLVYFGTQNNTSYLCNVFQFVPPFYITNNK